MPRPVEAILWVGVTALLVSPQGVCAGTRYSLHFSRTSNAYRWSQSLNLGSWAIGKRLSASGSTSLTSNLTVAANSAGEDRWRDSNTASWSLSYPLLSDVTLGVGLAMNKSSDSFTRDKEPFAAQSLNSTLSYRPFSGLSMSQSVGRTFDRRLGHRESGMGYSFSLSARPESIWGSATSFSYRKSGNSLKRKDLNESLSLSLARKWTSRINTSLGLSESNRKQNYYPRAEEDILETHSTFSRTISGSATVGSGKYFRISNAMRYSENRTLDSASDDSTNLSKWGSDRESKHLKLLDADLTLRVPPLPKLSYGVSYSTSTSRYLANQWGYRRGELDRHVTDLSMSTSFGLPVTRLDSVHVTSMMRITRTTRDDASDSLEVTDRDDLYSNVQANWTHKDKDFRATTTFRHSRSHTVNLHETLSAGNKRRETYALRPSIFYTIGDALSLSHSFDLSATYTNYDYELDPDKLKSRVSRNLSMDTSVSYRVSKALRLSSGYQYNESDYGTYSEKTNLQAIESESKRHSADLSSSYSFADWLDLSAGYTFSRTLDWRRGQKSEKTSKSVHVSVSFGTQNPVSVSGSYNVREGETYKNVSRTCRVGYTHVL